MCNSTESSVRADSSRSDKFPEFPIFCYTKFDPKGISAAMKALIGQIPDFDSQNYGDLPLKYVSVHCLKILIPGIITWNSKHKVDYFQIVFSLEKNSTSISQPLEIRPLNAYQNPVEDQTWLSMIIPCEIFYMLVRNRHHNDL